MKIKSAKILVILSILALTLSGCIKMSTTATVNQDGTLTGSSTFEGKASDLPYVLEQIDGFDGNFGYRFGVSAISFDSLSNCEVSNITFTLNEAAPLATHVSFSYVPDDTDESLFVVGAVSAGGLNTMRLGNAVVIPASGNIADCQNLNSVETGKIVTYSDQGYLLSFGGIKDVRTTNSEGFDFTAGLLIEQMANLPEEDRGTYLLLLEMMLGADMEIYSDSLFPELKPCGKYSGNKKLNALNFREMRAGEFEGLIDSFKDIKLIHTDEVFSITCKYTNMPLDYFDRGANEYPGVTESPQEQGQWIKVDQDLVWHYEMDANEGMSYNDVIADEGNQVVELSAGDELFGDASAAYEQLTRSLVSNKLKISGVILGTNGTVRGNEVTFVNRPWYYSSLDEAFYYLEGYEPENYEMDAVLGLPVLFESNASKIKTKATAISKFAKKKTHVEVKKIVKLIGIYDGSLTDPVKALNNEKLVAKRLKAVKAILAKEFKKLGVKATFQKKYVVDNDPSGDLKAKHKITIQILNPTT